MYTIKAAFCGFGRPIVDNQTLIVWLVNRDVMQLNI